MKHIIIIITLIASALLVPAKVDAQRQFEEVSRMDSLVNQDTVIQEFAYTFKRPYLYSVQIQADSISGANAGTCYLQVTNDRATSGTKWHTVQTLTIDGTASSVALWEGTLYARRARVYYISPSGTRKVYLYTLASFKAPE